MANRDQTSGYGAGRSVGRGPEPRAFGEARRGEGGEPWRGQARYDARYDQERTGYGGQAYGMEGGRDHRAASERDRGWRDDERETWRPDQGEPYGDLELNARNRGVQEFGPPADYAYHPRAGHEFDSDYLHWREAQMRRHDRDYHEWRSSQQQSYDDDYRKFRDQRREDFGRTFEAWRNQRVAAGGVADTGVQPGVSGYGAKVGMPSGYDAGQGSKPSGTIEPPHAINASPTATQSGGSASGGGGQSASGGTGDTTPEFGKEPPLVRAASDGSDGRDAADERQDSGPR